MNFTDKLKRSVQSSGSLLCVGLDPVLEKIPAPLKQQYSDDSELIFEFCRRIITITKPTVCAFKPNMAFFESMGSRGWEVLERVVDAVPSNRILIADAKRGDIGNTSDHYRKAFFSHLDCDAVTLNPLMGLETLKPFLSYPEKALFVLVMTSNKGASEFLQRRFEGRTSLAEYISEELGKMQHISETHLGMVVGATQARDLDPVLAANRDAHLLIPGLGTQGGSISEMANVLANHRGYPLFNSSRSIIYAGGDEENWEEMVSRKVVEMNRMINPLFEKYAEKTA
ncbi:MAG: orotidine-5'-phosphate decarboxylase [Balneolaceae bacterium]|nr:orotidine-5'-phosphate decarboxylase [Balneolaceae bacterium]MCH8549410.1 orotidine-5'-phosphate decarboxylase [Balneolaceae bacterium]